MIIYLVFAYEKNNGNLVTQGGMDDLYCQLTFTDDRTALEQWLNELVAYDDFNLYEFFELVRINPSSFVELDTFTTEKL